jgi:hypothetical protein
MFTELTLTHACDQTIAWSAGGFFDRKGRPITHCPTCGEWLGAPFMRIEEGRPLVRCERRGATQTAQPRSTRASAHLKAS